MGLKCIALRDFVIVRELELDLTSGFTVLTGETGAGKSILVDALQLVTGARADTSLIREGADRTVVSAEFDHGEQFASWLEENGFEAQAGSEALLLRRTVDSQGKSRAWINGVAATVTQLRALGEQLIDIHGQHAWQSLTRPDAVRQLLDAYGQINTAELSSLWQQWRQAQTSLEESRAAQDNLERERERLSWQIGELHKLSPLPGEWEELSTQHSRLANAQALLDAAQGALELLDSAESNTTHTLSTAIQLLQIQEHIEPDFKGLNEVLTSSLAQIEDASHSLRAYLRNTELEPDRLASLDTRMTLWISLSRRYRCPPEELAAQLASWQQELARLEAAADLSTLQTREVKTRDAYMRLAKDIAQARARAAPKLSQAITLAMQGLGMQGGKFEVSLQAATQPMQSGLDDVAFLVAGHTGSTPRPVGKVASGGELSRIALAIAVTTSRLGQAQTLIFDEVDSGVGGAVAQTVGRLMRQLGQDRQVLAVTHLPQVAACADHHLVVIKELLGSTTLSQVHAVSGETRANEVARMLGGGHLSGTTLAHAKEMLQNEN